MLDFLIHEIIINQFFLGFLSFMLFREWLFPKLRRWLTDGGNRYLAIWRHYKLQALGAGHGTINVTDCSEGLCVQFKV